MLLTLALSSHGHWAARWAFIHVVDPALGLAPDSGVPAAGLIASAQQDATRLLAELRQRTSSRQRPLGFVQVGEPAAEIVKAAKDWPADLIVIGSHGCRGVARAVLGSVAEAVVRHAPCPVLVVRAEA
jgi:nucleotide-binding universal stress UspA family protein